MTHVTCRLTAKNPDQLRNPTLGNRVWATFFTLVSQQQKGKTDLDFIEARDSECVTQHKVTFLPMCPERWVKLSTGQQTVLKTREERQ